MSRYPALAWRAMCAIALLGTLMAGAADAQERPRSLSDRRVGVTAVNGVTAGQFVVSLGKSQILQVDQTFGEITVGNPEVADVVPLTRQSVYVLGKKLGSTNLIFMGGAGRPLAVVDVVVTYDVEGLKQKLFELLPGETIEVRPANDGLVLSGQVSSPDRLARALTIAEQYAPKKIGNLLQVGGSSQVMLEVRFAEVDRQAGKALSLSSALRLNNFTAITGFPGAVLGQDTVPFASALYTRGDFDARLDALERKGLVTILAEPNLVVQSGDTASFLAGGEFPIPVAQTGQALGGASAITVEFKQFGVGLNFTPTVIGKDVMNLVIKTEVSDLDRSLAAQSSFGGGVQIPGLRVRRTETTVEVRDGQAFAISGLLRQDFTDTVAQVPWLSDIPILGTLFRSSQYRQQKTELVVYITPRLVQPVAAGTLAIPHDFTNFPSEADIFLGGKIEGGANRQRMSGQGGGVTGPHGYIIK
jgi:pilus assembly protein CpaC